MIENVRHFTYASIGHIGHALVSTSVQVSFFRFDFRCPRHAILCLEIDMGRWEALFGIVNVAILCVPVFVAIFASSLTIKQRQDERERRIAAYKKSPESQLLRLNY